MRIAALLVCAACVPLPFASPPIKATIGGGRYFETRADTPESSGNVFDLTVSAQPQQLLGSPLDRAFDIGAGYRFQLVEHGRLRHGGFVSAALLFALNAGGSWRATVHAGGDLMFRGSAIGGGGTAGGGIEFVVETDGEAYSSVSTGTAMYGWMWGEAGIGLDVSGGVFAFEDGPDFTLAASLVLRSPASLGILLVALAD